MKSNLFLLTIIMCTLIAFSCQDIIEKNLESQTIVVLAPKNGTISSSLDITFWWDQLEGAEKYKLQVVRPGFSNIQSLVIDTNVTGYKFTHTFSPGKYEWRIQAFNGSSSTEYFVYSFSVDSMLDLQNQSVNLLLPANNTISTQLTQHFKWSKLSLADDYRIEIQNASGSIEFLHASYIADTITHTFALDGVYKWRVRAQNISSVSPYTEFNITIDNTAPLVPLLVSPENGDSTSMVIPPANKAPFTLAWNRSASSTTTVISDSLYIYLNSISTIAKLSRMTTGTTYTDSLAVGTYFWKVRSIDAAGNKSPYSPVQKFIIK